MNTQVTLDLSGTTETVTVTCDPSVIASQLCALKSSVLHPSKLVIGMDVEWNFAASNAKPALLHLCTRTRCLIIQLRHKFSIPPELKDFLANSEITFVGVGIQSDVAKLKEWYGLSCANAVELFTLAAAKIKNTKAVTAGRDPVELSCFFSGSFVLAHDEIRNAASDAYAKRIIRSCWWPSCKFPKYAT